MSKLRYWSHTFGCNGRGCRFGQRGISASSRSCYRQTAERPACLVFRPSVPGDDRGGVHFGAAVDVEVEGEVGVLGMIFGLTMRVGVDIERLLQLILG